MSCDFVTHSVPQANQCFRPLPCNGHQHWISGSGLDHINLLLQIHSSVALYTVHELAKLPLFLLPGLLLTCILKYHMHAGLECLERKHPLVKCAANKQTVCEDVSCLSWSVNAVNRLQICSLKEK